MKYSREEILNLLEYDKINGTLVWKVKRGSTVKPGTVAGTETSYGSLQMSLFGKRVQVSHVVWFLETGIWPDKIIDHEDRNPKNNKFTNLRHVSSEINILHEIHKDSEEGVYKTSSNKYAVIVQKNNHSICVGSYKNAKSAHEVLRACQKLKKE